MNRKEMISSMRQVLIKRRDTLRKALNYDTDSLKNPQHDPPVDVGDLAFNTANGDVSSCLAEVEARELGRIEAALERMNQGKYGVCEICGKNIPMVRLGALPFATSCVNCQREVERQGAALASELRKRQVIGLSDDSDDDGPSLSDIELDVS